MKSIHIIIFIKNVEEIIDIMKKFFLNLFVTKKNFLKAYL